MVARTTKKPTSKNAKSAPNKNFFFVAGSDEGAVKEHAAALFDRLLSKWGGEFAAEILDGAAESAEQAIQRAGQFAGAVQSLPMFADKKLVWLKNINFMGDDVLGRSDAAERALEIIASALEVGLPEWCAVIISTIAPDKRRRAFKTLSTLGESDIYDKLDETRPGWEEEAMSRTIASLKQRGITAEEDAILLLIQRVGADTRALAVEMEKLDLYIGERRKLTEEDVALLVAPTRGAVVFELGNAIAAGRTARALELLDALFAQNETAMGILLAAIVPTIRNLLVAKDLLERHKLPRPVRPFDFTRSVERLPPSATAHLPRKKDGSLSLYPLSLAAIHASRFSTKHLRSTLHACADANIRLVTTQTDPHTVLAALIVSASNPE